MQGQFKSEKSFEGHYPVLKIPVQWSKNKDSIRFDFDGTGFVLRGDASQWESKSDYIFKTQLSVDGKLVESPDLPVSFTTRRHELCWRYQLPKGNHTVHFKILNPSKEHEIRLGDAIIYSDHLINGMQLNIEAAKNSL